MTSPVSFATGWSPVCEVDDLRAAGSRARSGRRRRRALVGAAMTIARVHPLDQPRRRARPARGVRRSRTCPRCQGYAVACLLPRRTAARRRRLATLRELREPARRLRVASLMRPPRGRRGRRALSRRARPRGGGAGPSATTRTGRRRRTRDRPAATRGARAREGRLAARAGLEPRFFCGGGWYTDGAVERTVRSSASSTAPYATDCRVPACCPRHIRSAGSHARFSGRCPRTCTRTSTTSICSTRGGASRSSRLCLCWADAARTPTGSSSLAELDNGSRRE